MRALIESLEVRQLLAAGDPYISEFLADNRNVIQDGHNAFSDFIEIHNPGAAAANLNGWRLTDEKAQPAKFTFGDFSIPAGGYRLVFASGTTQHTDPAGYVHTGFGLNNGGEYLALSKPNGEIVSAWDPEFPEQSPNVSYGIGPGGGSGITPLPVGAAAKMHVPTNGVLGTGWTAPGFNDGGWTSGNTGVGFEANTLNVPPLPNEIESNSSFAQANNAATNFVAGQTDRYQLGFSGNIGAASDVDFFRLGALQVGDVITISLSGSSGSRGTLADPLLELRRGNNAGTLVLGDNDTGPNTDSLIYRYQVAQNDTFYIRASGNAGAAGSYQVGVFLENTGAAPSTVGDVTQETESNDTGAAANDLSASWRRTGYLSRTAGDLTTDYFRFQFYAGDRVTVVVNSNSSIHAQVSLYNGNQALLASEDGTSDLTLPDAIDSSIYSYVIPATGTYYVLARPQAGNGGSYNLDVYLSSPNTPPRPPQLTGQFATSVQGDMYNKNATAYVRVPFSVANAAGVSQLTLRMKYEDGFVAYLNGTKVAERNAPGAPVWNSAATADRAIAQATAFEDIDISQFRHLLVNGSGNVLAIHGLNSAANSDEFLIVPELTAQTNSTGAPQYFYTPTPAQPNIAGAGVVINEIHYNPDVETQLVEFVELHNSSTTPISISGWKFSNGVAYTFPTNTTIDTGQYLVLTENAAQFQSKYGFAPFAEFVGSLSNEGERLTLVNAANQTIDEVDYGAGFPWPTVGDQITTPGTGGSIQLINPGLDNDLGGHWRSAVPTPANRNTGVFAANSAPALRQVSHSPGQPTSNQPVTITTKVTDPDGVSSVSLQYQVNAPGNYIPYQRVNTSFQVSVNPAYEQGWVTVAMYDDGTRGDATPGDGVYSAQIPGNVNQHRRLIRYRITAADSLGTSIRGPYADDPSKNFAYFVYDGVPGWSGAVQPGVTAQQNFSAQDMNRLPVYFLITDPQDVANASHVPTNGLNPQMGGYGGSEYLWAGTFVYDGKVYDNIRYRARGGVWRYAMGKNMWKFDFNRNHEFQPRDDYGREYPVKWKKLNFSAIIQQGDFGQRGEQGLFESVGFKLFNLAGVGAPYTHYNQFRVIDGAAETGPTQYDGDLWGLYLSVEQPDGQFLKAHGMPDGNLYKMEGGTGELNNQGPTQPSNRSDLNSFQSTYNSGPTDQWWRDNFNLESYYSYQAIVQGIHHYDIADGKNYLFYHNPEDGRWETAAWDIDLTWADNMYRGGVTGGDEPFKSRVLPRPAFNLEYKNRLRELQDLLFNDEQVGYMIDQQVELVDPAGMPNSPVDYDRALWDYNPILVSGSVNGGKAGHGRFYGAVPSGTFRGMAERMKEYVAYRNSVVLDPLAADSLIPNRPVATYAGPAGYPTDQLRFRSSAFSSSNSSFASIKWRVAEVYDPSNPYYTPGMDRPYEITAQWESPEITTFNNEIVIPGGKLIPGRSYRVRVKMKDANGRWSNWSGPVQFRAGVPDTSINALRVTELMYHPADPPIGSTFTDNDFEYVELMNTGAGFLDLSGVKLAGGIDFTFPDSYQLGPGERTLVVANLAAFQSRYPNWNLLKIAGTYLGRLSNDDDQIRLEAGSGQTILDFEYQDGWYPQTDGEGFSLAIINPTADPSTWSDNQSWRVVMPPNGAPGLVDPGLNPNSVVVNEILANPATPGQGWIELRNTTNAAINISGWFLSDDGESPRKYKFGPNTVLQPAGQAGSILVLNEQDTFGTGANAFSLSRFGGTLYISAADGEQTLLGYRDVQDYRASDVGVTLGRHLKSTGRQDFTALSNPTGNALNSLPKVGPVVINEVMYNPPAGANEYVEIRNITGQTVNLSGWRFDGITFTFPDGAALPAHGYALVVPIDPAVFRTTYNIPANVQIFGPFFGLIDDSGENVELQKPGVPDSGFTPYVTVDRVSYEAAFPWPTSPNGSGPSLLRKDYNAYGNDVVNWAASTGSGGSPGKPNFAPTAAGGFDLATRRGISVRFTEDVGASLQAGDMVLQNLSGGSVPALSVSWDPATLTGTWTFAGNPADGNYRAALTASGVSDWAGQQLAGPNPIFNFFILAGDINYDRAVNNADFLVLQSNFGQSGKTYSDGDLSGNGKVDFADYQMLGRLLNRTLAAPAEPVGAAPVEAPVAGAPAPVPTPIRTVPASKTRPAPAPKPVAPMSVAKPVAKKPAFATRRINTLLQAD